MNLKNKIIGGAMSGLVAVTPVANAMADNSALTAENKGLVKEIVGTINEGDYDSLSPEKIDKLMKEYGRDVVCYMGELMEEQGASLANLVFKKQYKIDGYTIKIEYNDNGELCSLDNKDNIQMQVEGNDIPYGVFTDHIADGYVDYSTGFAKDKVPKQYNKFLKKVRKHQLKAKGHRGK